MKTHKEREGGDAEGDQSMTMADVEQSYKKKEKKMKEKKNLPLMACNSEVEEDGNEEAAMDANEEMEEGEKLKKKVKTDDVMMSDEKERKEEKKKKKKKEKRDRMMLSDDKETKVEKKKNELIGDTEVERSELRRDENVKADGEGGKGEKEKKRKRKEKERNGDKAVDKEQSTPKEKKKELIGDSEVERSELRSDGNVKADGEGDKVEKEKKRKRKEKERNGDKTVHEEQNTPNDTKEKKKRKRDQMMDDKETRVDAVVSGNGREVEQNKLRDDMKADDEGNKGEKKKKRKEKETKGDVVLHEEPSTGNDKKENKKEKVNGVKGDKPDNKEKRRKGKETKDDMVSGHKELNKGKEKNKEMEAGEAENPEEQRDEMQKSKKRASAADSSENVIPKRRSRRVKFSDEVTVFPPPNNSNKGKKVRKKLKFLDDADALEELQGKRFTKEEDKLIIKAVHDYIEAKQLGEDGVNMVMHCKAHGLRGCWREIRKALPWRFREAIYTRAHSLLERGDDVGNWTKEQVDFVVESHKKHGTTWRELSDEMGRYRIHVKDIYRRHKLANRKRGHWSQEEYQTLFDLVNKDLQMKVHAERRYKHGMLRQDISWGAISDTLGTRNQVSCWDKWYSQLSSPMVGKGEWDDVDDYMLLMELVELDPSCEEEVDWDSLLEHRSGAVCHRRWKQMTNHLGEHRIKSFSEQVEVLSNRYCPYLLETKQKLDARPYVDL